LSNETERNKATGEMKGKKQDKQKENKVSRNKVRMEGKGKKTRK
jgi:hypothetical protein